MEKKVYFVILHYQTISETVECIESILKNVEYDNKHIVVVDNASPNKSGSYLKDYYENNNNVKIIINEENLGFARGNNIGYDYAKKNGAQYIIQVNSDTIFLDKFFIHNLIKIHEEKEYAVLGPKIVALANGELQNPLKNGVKTIKQVERKICIFKIKLMLSYLNADQIIKKIFKHREEFEEEQDKEYIEINEDVNVLLHGCCFIFSPQYINEFDGMFDGTFMYYEEHILYYLCIKKKLKMLYTNKIKLYHRRNASTKEVHIKAINRRRFIYRESIKSLISFKNFIKSQGDF